jgi:hypothetical protein
MSLDISLEYRLDLNGDTFFDTWKAEPTEETELWISVDEISELDSQDCHFNITHNLGKMASKCKLYEPLWRPYELFNILEKDEYDAIILAKDIISYVEEGLKNLLNNKETLFQYEPVNGWGSYDALVSFTQRYLKCLKRHPNSKIRISR